MPELRLSGPAKLVLSIALPRSAPGHRYFLPFYTAICRGP